MLNGLTKLKIKKIRVGRGIGSGKGKTSGSCLFYTSPSPRD